MDYQTTLHISLNGYPTLYEEEEQALHHLFFVNGNGYSWIDGELRESGRDDARDPEEIIRAIWEETKRAVIGLNESWGKALREFGGSPHFDDEIAAIESGRYIEWAREHNKQRRKAMKKLGEYPDEKSLYPICEYAKIVNLPDDIKPDWLEAAKKAMDVAEGRKKTPEDERWLKKARKRIKELEIG